MASGQEGSDCGEGGQDCGRNGYERNEPASGVVGVVFYVFLYGFEGDFGLFHVGSLAGINLRRQGACLEREVFVG